MFNEQFFDLFTKDLKLVINDFDAREFVSQVMDDEWEGRELKQRCMHITTVLRKFLPADYKEAIAKIASWKPSVILLDAHLQDVNSFEVLDSCREGRATVVVASDVCSREIMDSARDHGASGYVTKSESPEEIEALLFELATVSAPIEVEH